ncbi:MAG: amino acid aminotransferase [Pseudomonadota bacterium]
MLQSLGPAREDKIIALMQAFRADPRTDKVDLGVGVYKDASGNTPIFAAVKQAEEQLWQEQGTKGYTALLGNADYIAAMQALTLGDAVPAERLTAAQAVGGTGALRTLFQLVLSADPEARFWISDPSWPNHAAILEAMGAPWQSYRYFDRTTRMVDVEGMHADLADIGPHDVVVLHGCCHNPTGANLTAADWAALTAHFAATGATPLIDIAYQGFGDGLEEDAAGLRTMAAGVPQLLIAASCSKNFGVYRDRVGCAIVLAETQAIRDRVAGALTAINRTYFSFTPDHGAAVVAKVLTDPALRQSWETELKAMRTRMLALREGLADALRRETNSDRFDFLAAHRGMFSLLGATPEQLAELKERDGIYIVGDSRVNVAGLPEDGLPALARALVSAGV